MLVACPNLFFPLARFPRSDDMKNGFGQLSKRYESIEKVEDRLVVNARPAHEQVALNRPGNAIIKLDRAFRGEPATDASTPLIQSKPIDVRVADSGERQHASPCRKSLERQVHLRVRLRHGSVSSTESLVDENPPAGAGSCAHFLPRHARRFQPGQLAAGNRSQPQNREKLCFIICGPGHDKPRSIVSHPTTLSPVALTTS